MHICYTRLHYWAISLSLLPQASSMHCLIICIFAIQGFIIELSLFHSCHRLPPCTISLLFRKFLGRS